MKVKELSKELSQIRQREKELHKATMSVLAKLKKEMGLKNAYELMKHSYVKQYPHFTYVTDTLLKIIHGN